MRELIDYVRAGKIKPIPIATVPISSLNDSLAELLAGKVQGRQVLVHDDHSTQFGERPRLQQHCGALSSVARAEHAGLRPILRECCHDTSAAIDRDGIQSQYPGDDESLSSHHSGEDRGARGYSGAVAQIHNCQYRDDISDDYRRFGLCGNRARSALLANWGE
jgi:hypothetical protein